MKRIPIQHTVVLTEGVFAQVFVNDLPLFKHVWTGPESQGGALNHLLVPGSNRVAFEIHRAPPPAAKAPAAAPASDAAQGPARPPYALGEGQCMMFMLYTVADPDAQPVVVDLLQRWSFPELWEGLPEDKRRLPFYHEVSFELDIPVYERAFVNAPPASFGCRGTPELLQAVAEVLDAVAARDLDRFMNAVALESLEQERAFEGHAEALASGRRQLYEELFRHPLSVAPLDPATLHFAPRAGGRVAHVTRHTGAPVLEAVLEDNPNRRMRANFLLTQHDGRWRVM